MKIFFNKIRLYFKIQHCLFLLRKYLPNGFYSLQRQCKNYLIKKQFKLIPFLVISFKKYIPLSPIGKRTSEIKFVITPYQHKVLFFIGKEVYSFLSAKDGHKFLDKIKRYGDELKLPINKKTILNYKKRMTVEPLLFNLCSEVDPRKVVDILFVSAAESKKYDKDYKKILGNFLPPSGRVISYIQHGDVRDANIMLKDNEYCLIDYDELDIYPFLYDFFRYVFREKQTEIWNDFLSGTYNIIICDILGVDLKDFDFDGEMDFYLALFLFIIDTGFDDYNVQMIPKNWSLSISAIVKKVVDY